jgi:hypothetical protein
MSILPPFRLVVPATPELRTGPSAPPLELCITFNTEESESESEVVDTPATSRRKGSLNWDREKGGYTHEWADFAEFTAWCQAEERAYLIEFISKTRATPRVQGAVWTERRLFECARAKSKSGNAYQKKTESQRKIGSKRTGCGCKIVIKHYPHTLTILGYYDAEHDHDIGLKNVPYTRLSNEAWERINIMLSQNIEPKYIVSFLI